MHAPEELHEKWRKVYPQFDDKIGKYGAGPGENTPDVQNPIAGFAAMMENLDNQSGGILDSSCVIDILITNETPGFYHVFKELLW